MQSIDKEQVVSSIFVICACILRSTIKSALVAKSAKCIVISVREEEAVELYSSIMETMNKYNNADSDVRLASNQVSRI